MSSQFSKDEADVIRGVSKGRSNLEIATQLGWPEEKVAQCLDRILAKLKLSSRIELAFYAGSAEGQAALRESEA
jgi:DNA-binding NarL/FixJ family response regulator